MRTCRTYREKHVLRKTARTFLRDELRKYEVIVDGKLRYARIVNSNPVCLHQWLLLFGFNKRDSTVSRALRECNDAFNTSGSSSTQQYTRKVVPSKRHNFENQIQIATRWCVQHIKLHMGDLSPTSGKHMLTKPITKVWHSIFMTDAGVNHTHTGISRGRFAKALQENIILDYLT